MAASTQYGFTESSLLAADNKDNHGNDNIDPKLKELIEKGPSIFDSIKSGVLIPVQTLVEFFGSSILSKRDEKGHTPAHWACLGGHSTILRFIIEKGGPVNLPSDDDRKQKPIHWACVNGHIQIVDILLQFGVPLDTTDEKAFTPLLVAAQYGHTLLVGYLLGKGANKDSVDTDGDSALHWAAFKGHNELMRLLVYSGLNPHQRDNYNQTPLHLSCINGNITSVKDLCELDDVDVNIADKNCKTPLMLALGRKHTGVVQYLKKHAKKRTSLIQKIDLKSLVFGPPGNSKFALIFFLFFVIVWGYPMYIFKCLPITYAETQFLHFFFWFLNIIMWICLYHASTIDPGFLARNTLEYDQAIREVARFSDWKQDENPLTKLCHTCRTVRPQRSKHCRICNRCVKQFDHHCPYIYNCVGYNNRTTFFIFNFCLLISGFNALIWDYIIWKGEKWVLRLDYPLGIIATLYFMWAASFITFNTVSVIKAAVTI